MATSTSDADLHAIVWTGVADLNGDFDVDAGDMGDLLAAWCTSCTSDADLDCDGKVDGDDLGVLLADWTGSDNLLTVPAICDICPGESELSGGSSGLPVAAALAFLGFGSIDAFKDWAADASAQQIEAAGAVLHALVTGE